MKALATILLIVGASLAYPADEEQTPLPAQLPASLPEQSQDLQPLPEQAQQGLELPRPGLEEAQPGLEQAAQQSTDNSDLKTDATIWFGGSFFPYGGYRRSYSYYRPRARYDSFAIVN